MYGFTGKVTNRWPLSLAICFQANFISALKFNYHTEVEKPSR